VAGEQAAEAVNFSFPDPRLVFDEEQHTYVLDGNAVPSVTTVLRPGTPDFEKYYTPESRARGTKVHRMVQYDVEGTLDIGALDDELLLYYEAWQNFRLGTNFVPELCEQPVFYEAFGYAGTLDLYGKLDGKPALIDIKTGVVTRTARAQTMAYLMAASYMGMIPHATRRFVLDLKPGRAQLSKEYTANKSDQRAFMAFLYVRDYNNGRYDHEFM
jgi:hypothetical protein